MSNFIAFMRWMRLLLCSGTARRETSRFLNCSPPLHLPPGIKIGGKTGKPDAAQFSWAGMGKKEEEKREREKAVPTMGTSYQIKLTPDC